MSRKDALPARERRLRRLAIRYGLHLMKAQKPDRRVLAHGGYMLRDAESFRILFGDAEYLFSASLGDVELWLARQRADAPEAARAALSPLPSAP